MSNALFDLIPNGLLALTTVAIFALAVQAGLRLALRRKGQAAGDRAAEGVGPVVGALFGLLAFMLAFTFGMAASRREARRDLLLEEVNSLGTTWLRAGLLPQPHPAEVRALLKRYVELRIDAAEHPEKLAADLAEASKLQRELWKHAEALTAAELEHEDIVALFIDSLNETIDLQTKRVTVGSYRIPLIIWLTFLVITVVAAMALGYSFGLQSPEPRWLMTLMLAASFATVIYLIIDLDRGNEGWLKLNQQPMAELLQQMTP